MAEDIQCLSAERELGYDPVDREKEKIGYDIESPIPGTGRVRMIEVKGRDADADTITVSKNEILTSLNKPDDFILAVVEFIDGDPHKLHYIWRPFIGRGITIDFNGASVNFPLDDLLARAEAPR